MVTYGFPCPGPAVLRSAFNFCHHLALDGEKAWRPLLAVHYLTYACAFRCPYCSDGAQNPYYTLREPPLDASRALELLRGIRAHCEHLVLTGGEPLTHPELGAILEGLPGLGFAGVVFTTNGHGLQPHLPALARCVTELVVSVDTLDAAKADAWFGRGPGVLVEVVASLDAALAMPGRRFEVVISAVVTPGNLDDLMEVYRWSQARGCRFAACPQLEGIKAHPALAEDPRYRAFYDLLLRDKRGGANIQGTVPYLTQMRDLSRFRCRPSALLVVSPQGHVFHPCLERGQFAGNLLEEPDLHALRKAGRARFGPQPDCGTCWHSACALGFASLLAHPWSLVPETWRQARVRFKGCGRTMRA